MRQHHPITLLWLAVRALASGIAVIALTTILQVVVVRVVTPPWTVTMLERAVEEGQLPARRIRSLPRLGEFGPRAFVASEDAKFFLHHGFDGQAMCEAIRDGLAGERFRGASTISQQVAKNVFLWGGRSLQRKLFEAWYTFWMERLMSKERILELYVNVAETGPLTFGLESGARHHFGTSAAQLDRSQAGRLAGILPNPQRSISGKAAWSRATWIARHPAPFPDDRTFAMVQKHYDGERKGVFSCFW